MLDLYETFHFYTNHINAPFLFLLLKDLHLIIVLAPAINAAVITVAVPVPVTRITAVPVAAATAAVIEILKRRYTRIRAE